MRKCLDISPVLLHIWRIMTLLHSTTACRLVGWRCPLEKAINYAQGCTTILRQKQLREMGEHTSKGRVTFLLHKQSRRNAELTNLRQISKMAKKARSLYGNARAVDWTRFRKADATSHRSLFIRPISLAGLTNDIFHKDEWAEFTCRISQRTIQIRLPTPYRRENGPT